MDVVEAIEARRSIRKFQAKAVSKATLEQLLTLATKAPSGKNRQPWRFVVLQDAEKAEFAEVMSRAISKLQEKGMNIGSGAMSAGVIKEASAVIVVFNAFSNFVADYSRYTMLMDIQSIGAAVQNLILAAQSKGLGTLWICDIFYCTQELCRWLNRKEEMIAAVAIGWPEQTPAARPRAPLAEVMEWGRLS